MSPNSVISDRLAVIRQRIDSACSRVGRDPSEVTLVAVSKTFPFGCIQEAVFAGQFDFGENYLQDCLKKIVLADEQGLSSSVRWHFIGHLQRNKARFLDFRFYLFHALDSLGLANRLNRLALNGGYCLDVLVQVNLSREETKSGIVSDQLVEFIRQLNSMPGLGVRGLMTIPPPASNPEDNRIWFAQLRDLLISAQRQLALDTSLFNQLSMGMSADFEVAIEEGATLIRVGSAIFGPREHSAKK